MSQVQRIVIRTGLASAVPALLLAEMGWDYDTKTLRVGDATATPPRIMTTKSTGNFDFSSVDNVTFKNILLASGGKIQGIDLDSLNAQQGIVVRAATSGLFTHTQIVSGDNTLSVTNGAGLAGNIDIRLDPDLLELIESFAGVVSTAASTAPSVSKAGDLWCDTDTDVLFIRANMGAGLVWLDISSVGSGGISHTSSSGSPVSPVVGDEWYSTTEDIMYKYSTPGWMQIS